jgi:gp16 family phage-associated protein
MSKPGTPPPKAPNKRQAKLVISPEHARAKAWFDQTGTSVAEWARQNKFPVHLVYNILAGRITKRGKSHEIAVSLGIKTGVIRGEKGGAK